jgi:hypothetical protein
MPQNEEVPIPVSPADMGEAEEGERLWLAKTLEPPISNRITTELDDPGLVGMHFQSERFQSLFERGQEPPRIIEVLETHHGVIRVPHDDDLASGVTLAPLLDPEVIDVVQVDVGEGR